MFVDDCGRVWMTLVADALPLVCCKRVDCCTHTMRTIAQLSQPPGYHAEQQRRCRRRLIAATIRPSVYVHAVDGRVVRLSRRRCPMHRQRAASAARLRRNAHLVTTLMFLCTHKNFVSFTRLKIDLRRNLFDDCMLDCISRCK